jgi:ribosomal protein L33
MAEAKRIYVWMECSVCHSRNYRTSRPTKILAITTDERGNLKTRPPRSMTPAGKLALRKFCRKCRKETLHNEQRKK